MIQNSYKILFIQIEQKREEMISLGTKHGLTSPEVIQASQQLDRLLNNLSYLKDCSCEFK